MVNIKGFFKKKPDMFYNYLLLITNNIVQSADVFIEQLQFLHDHEKASGYAQQMKTLERTGDRYTHEVIHELHRTFITPLEREDILGLVLQLDDVLDCLEFCSSHMVLYNITQPDEYIRLFSCNIHLCVQELAAAIEKLTQNKLREMTRHTHRINDLENAADELVRDAIPNLFQNCPDPIEIIKKKEIYTMMEAFSDFCEDVADILEGVIMRNC